MNPRSNQAPVQTKAARSLFRVKSGRVLLFPNVPTENNQHLWARAGEVVDATHPALRAIINRAPHNVLEITEAGLAPGEEPVKRLHASVKHEMKAWDEREATRVARATSAAAAKAKGLGVDPSALPRLAGKQEAASGA